MCRRGFVLATGLLFWGVAAGVAGASPEGRTPADPPRVDRALRGYAVAVERTLRDAFDVRQAALPAAARADAEAADLTRAAIGHAAKWAATVHRPTAAVPDGWPARQTLKAELDDLHDRGYREPLFGVLHRVIGADGASPRVQAPFFAAEAMAGVYPPAATLVAADLALLAQAEIRGRAFHLAPAMMTLRAKRYEQLVGLATGDGALPADVEVWIGPLVNRLVRDVPPDVANRLLPRLRPVWDAGDRAEAHPRGWLAGLVAGHLATEAAWEARGGGWASETSDERFAEMERLLALARPALEASFAQRPDVMSAAEMITNLMLGAGGGGAETMRRWFDRAVAVDPDEPTP